MHPASEAGTALRRVHRVGDGFQFPEELVGARVRLMRNADDHAQFLQIIQYQTDPSLEASRQKVASDPMLRNYMQAWRAVFPGPMEMDVYEDVTDGG